MIPKSALNNDEAIKELNKINEIKKKMQTEKNQVTEQVNIHIIVEIFEQQ